MSDPVLMPVDTDASTTTVSTPTVPALPEIPKLATVTEVKPVIPPVVEDDSTEKIVESFLPHPVYDFLKWLALIVLYAAATFVGAVGPAWGWPHVNEIVLTLTAAGTLLGAVLGVAKATAK